MRRLLPAIQRAMLRTDRGPLRRLWQLAYRAAARAYAAYVVRGETGASAYVRGTLASGEAMPGIADIDMAFVLPRSAEVDAARGRVRRRLRRGMRALPVVGELLFDRPAVYHEPALAEVASQTVFTYGLVDAPPRSAYFGRHMDADMRRLLERPEMYGPARSWRPLCGPDRQLPDAPRDADARRLTAWLELQNWWRWAFQACVEPDRPYNAYLCVKLIAEPVRAWLWLVQGTQVDSRVEALELGPQHLPRHAEAFERALALHGALHSMPAAPLAEFLPPLLELSAALAGEIAARVEPSGFTQVRLGDPSGDTLALPHGPRGYDGPLLPLVDWRSLAAPLEPDEAFAPVPGQPDPETIAALATGADRGPYPTLCARGLLIRPATMGGRQRLRALQCPPTDPVSFALLEGVPVAHFPNVAGWSIQDTARRAVAEHAAWLANEPGRRETRAGTVLGMLITAIRAGLLWEGVQQGEPELPLTVDATMELLAASSAGARGVADAARESYHDFAWNWVAPPEPVIGALRGVVERLPAYALDRRTPAGAAS